MSDATANRHPARDKIAGVLLSALGCQILYHNFKGRRNKLKFYTSRLHWIPSSFLKGGAWILGSAFLLNGLLLVSGQGDLWRFIIFCKNLTTSPNFGTLVYLICKTPNNLSVRILSIAFFLEECINRVFVAYALLKRSRGIGQETQTT
jgi:hypothetical protein